MHDALGGEMAGSDSGDSEPNVGVHTQWSEGAVNYNQRDQCRGKVVLASEMDIDHRALTPLAACPKGPLVCYIYVSGVYILHYWTV